MPGRKQWRNVALTAPYFHNGGKGSLLDVLEFYVKGGDFPNPELGTGIQKLNLTTAEHDALLDLLENGFTDCRVLKRRAPFDHPSLPVPNGPLLQAVGAQGTGACDCRATSKIDFHSRREEARTKSHLGESRCVFR